MRWANLVAIAPIAGLLLGAAAGFLIAVGRDRGGWAGLGEIVGFPIVGGTIMGAIGLCGVASFVAVKLFSGSRAAKAADDSTNQNIPTNPSEPS